MRVFEHNMVASTRTATEEGRVGSISVRAINDAVEEHEARTQPSTSGRVVEADGYSRRDDRQYHELYDGGNPGPSLTGFRRTRAHNGVTQRAGPQVEASPTTDHSIATRTRLFAPGARAHQSVFSS